MPPGYVHGETPYTLTMSRNKRGVTLDLKRPAGRDVFYRMVEKADVVLSSLGPGDVLDAVQASHPDTPVVVQVRTPGGEAPDGCEALPATWSVDGQIRVPRAAARAGNGAARIHRDRCH